MIELSFHRDLYSERAVDEAVRAFASVAEIERGEGEGVVVLRVELRYPRHQRRIVGELKNYALARTIDLGGSR